MTGIMERLRAWCSPAPEDRERIAVRVYVGGRLLYRAQTDFTPKDETSAYNAANGLTGVRLAAIRRALKKGSSK